MLRHTLHLPPHPPNSKDGYPLSAAPYGPHPTAAAANLHQRIGAHLRDDSQSQPALLLKDSSVGVPQRIARPDEHTCASTIGTHSLTNESPSAHPSTDATSQADAADGMVGTASSREFISSEPQAELHAPGSLENSNPDHRHPHRGQQGTSADGLGIARRTGLSPRHGVEVDQRAERDAILAVLEGGPDGDGGDEVSEAGEVELPTPGQPLVGEAEWVAVCRDPGVGNAALQASCIGSM